MKADDVSVLADAGWPVIILNDVGGIVLANPYAVQAFGSELRAEGVHLSALWPTDSDLELETFLTRLADNAANPLSVHLVAASGQPALFEAYVTRFRKASGAFSVVQLFAKGTSSNNTRVFEENVALRQKLDCALQLTRTVALDFNNALTSILGHTSLILNKMELDHPWRSSLVEVEKSAEKAAEVASDLAAFSREEKEVRAQVAGNLNELVRRTVELFQAPGGRRVAWALQLEPKLYTVSFDEPKLQQAFVKILDNAVQASQDTGQIIVRTRNQDITQTTHDGSVRLTPGHYVCVEFEDSGCGISPDVLPRIFEPFYTTKNSPNHRGLGLAWVYGIVTNHGGSVAVSSQPKRGTSVRVYLPAQKKIVRDLAWQSGDLSGNETILMIDDEELLLTMGEMVLSSFGYHVLTANSGHKALEIFVENQGEIDLVITDLVMPRMSGRELIEQLRRLEPDLKIICSSGYIRALNSQDEELYLQKPFTSLDLLRKVREALATAEPS